MEYENTISQYIITKCFTLKSGASLLRHFTVCYYYRCKISTHRTLYRLPISQAVFTYGAVSVGEITRHEAQLIDHLGEDDDGGPTQTQSRHEAVQLAERQPNDEKQNQHCVHRTHLTTTSPHNIRMGTK